MVVRLVNPDEFNKCIDDLDFLFTEENSSAGHFYLKHDKESIKSSLSNAVLLNWDVFAWGNKLESGNYDALIIFVNEKSIKFNTRIFSEFLWLSKNGKIGLKLLKTALDFAKQNKFATISISTVTLNPSYEKVRRLYKRLGFVKDSESYLLHYE